MKLPKLFSSRTIQQLHEESIKRPIAKQGRLRNAAKILVLQTKFAGDRCGKCHSSDLPHAETLTLDASEGVQACARDKERGTETYAELKGDQHVRSMSVGACTVRALHLCVTQPVQPK